MAKEVQVGTDEDGSPIFEVQVQPVDDLEAMGQWFSENPSALQLPAGKKMKGKNSFGKPTMQSVDEIPVYAETWDYTIQQPKVVVKN